MKRKSKNILITICLASLFIGNLATSLSAADNKEDELFFVAQKAFEDGFYDVALRYLDKFLKDFPETDKRPQVNLLIGQCYFFGVFLDLRLLVPPLHRPLLSFWSSAFGPPPCTCHRV